jgi:type II secretory ATPase GspE/PulE/Tfp pilus assembly ATPase PilB-like protein
VVVVDEILAQVLYRTNYRKVETRLVTETTFKRFIATRYASLLLMDQIAGDTDLEKTILSPGRGQNIVSNDEAQRRVRTEDPDAAMPLVVRLCNYILKEAIQQRASDIHIEPYETFFRIRYRVDGKLFTQLTPAQRLHMPMLSRIKILSEMDIAERRKPQDGAMSMRIGDEEVSFRVSTLPTVFGEKCVIRLLKKEAHLADLSRLGFRPEQLATIKKASRLAQGLILVTGPTGSGKTTTLHAVINQINDPDVNIVTLEDPVEQAIPGANHVQISEKAGLTFPIALRSVLRQDPDVVFVGEMRDAEVSSIAMRAALTGHLVLSTLHTNGIVETFNRLIDMGLETYLLASCVQLVVAQRLLRRLCSVCAKPSPLTSEDIKEFKLTPQQVNIAHHRVAVGCKQCADMGYRGRVAVYEMLSPNAALRDVLRRNAGEDAIRNACNDMGVVWMWEAGIARALAGETSFEEVRRVLSAPDI